MTATATDQDQRLALTLPVMGHASDLEARAQSIKLRRLEIAAALTEWKRAFIVDGVERPFKDRVTLEAEDAALALEARVISTHVEAAKVERRKRLNRTTLAHLTAMLKAAGLADMVAEAEKRAALELDAA